MDKKLSVIFSSHLSETENKSFIEHLQLTAGKVDLHIHCIENKGKYSLTQAYNLGWQEINRLGRGDGAIVFCHNDILFRTMGWGEIVIQILRGSGYSIIGVAGATELNSHGCWWMDETGIVKNDTKMVGRVWHTDGMQDWESIYTEKIGGVKATVMIDGLFMAIDGSAGLTPFDESFKGFHFYDVSFSFENYLEGFNVGVTDRISILHKSVGRTNQSWENNKIQFAEKYKDELPKRI